MIQFVFFLRITNKHFQYVSLGPKLQALELIAK